MSWISLIYLTRHCHFFDLDLLGWSDANHPAFGVWGPQDLNLLHFLGREELSDCSIRQGSLKQPQAYHSYHTFQSLLWTPVMEHVFGQKFDLRNWMVRQETMRIQLLHGYPYFWVTLSIIDEIPQRNI